MIQGRADLKNRRLQGFEGKLTSNKWAAMAKLPDTAMRDLNDLLERGMFRKI